MLFLAPLHHNSLAHEERVGIMGTRFGIVEIGSTNTKAYTCVKGEIISQGFHNIEFKKNRASDGKIRASDVDELAQFINSIFTNGEQVNVYGTSIFRNLGAVELTAFIDLLSKRTKLHSFTVVSEDAENELTTFGALRRFPADNTVCVFIGGGGSSEISICKNGNIIEMTNTPIGVTDVLRQFPDLSLDIAHSTIEEVTSYIEKILNVPEQSAQYLILAGGDFLLRYNHAKYPVCENDIFTSANHPYVIAYEANRKHENIYFYETKLSTLRKITPDTPKWWDGTRAMCAFTDVVARAVGAKIIIPTSISMVYGIADKLGHGLSI